MGGVLAGGDVAVGRHRDGDGLLDRADDVPVGLAGVHLHAGAPVHRQGRRAGLLGHAGEGHGVDAAPVPALAELHRHRHADALAHRLDDARGALHIAHQGRAVPGLDDLAHGAAHVDIHDLRAGERQRQGRGLGHDLRLMAEDLHRGGMLPLRQVAESFGLFVPVAQGAGGDHLRGGQGGALLPAEGAEGEIRHPRHGGQQHPPGQFYVSDCVHAVIRSPRRKESAGGIIC